MECKEKEEKKGKGGIEDKGGVERYLFLVMSGMTSYFQTISPINFKAGTPLISTSTNGAWTIVKPISSGSLLIKSRARIWSCNKNLN